MSLSKSTGRQRKQDTQAQALWTELQHGRIRAFPIVSQLRTLKRSKLDLFAYPADNNEALSVVLDVIASNKIVLTYFVLTGFWESFQQMIKHRNIHLNAEIEAEMDRCNEWNVSVGEFLKLAREADLDGVRKCASDDPSKLDFVDSKGNECMYWACVGGSVDIIKHLLKSLTTTHVIDQVRDTDGTPPDNTTIVNGRFIDDGRCCSLLYKVIAIAPNAIIEELLKQGAAVNETVLQAAVEADQELDTIKLLLRSSARSTGRICIYVRPDFVPDK